MYMAVRNQLQPPSPRLIPGASATIKSAVMSRTAIPSALIPRFIILRQLLICGCAWITSAAIGKLNGSGGILTATIRVLPTIHLNGTSATASRIAGGSAGVMSQTTIVRIIVFLPAAG